jgi:7-alpha-hydroxysteroid dehydrogenase
VLFLYRRGDVTLGDSFRVDGRVALVTAASRGIGAATAVALAESGADVVVAARTEEGLRVVADRAERFGRRVAAAPCDVMALDSLGSLVDTAMDRFGRLDILVNNAGGTPPLPFLETNVEMFESALRFNVTTAFEP